MNRYIPWSIPCRGSLGGLDIRSSVGLSMLRAMAGPPSVMRFSQRIIMGRNGAGSPARMNRVIIIISSKLLEIMNLMNFLMLS